MRITGAGKKRLKWENIFGTDGFSWRSNIVTLTVEHAYKVGRFLGWYFSKDHTAKVAIGKGYQKSSYMFEYSLVAGLTASAPMSTCSMLPPPPAFPMWWREPRTSISVS